MRLSRFALVLAVAGCATAPGAPYDAIAKQFRYKLDFERGEELRTPKDRVEILELWGTRPEIEIGGEYLVVGRYTLGSADEGDVYFWMTADSWDNTGPNMDLQAAEVRRGTGTFVLQSAMQGPGWFHVNLYGGGKEVADLYFGKGKTLYGSEEVGSAGQATVSRSAR